MRLSSEQETEIKNKLGEIRDAILAELAKHNELLEAVRDIVPDLERFCSKQGNGPVLLDEYRLHMRLARLKKALAESEVS